MGVSLMIKNNNVVYKTITCTAHNRSYGVRKLRKYWFFYLPDDIDFNLYSREQARKASCQKEQRYNSFLIALIGHSLVDLYCTKVLVIIASGQSLRGRFSNDYFTLQTINTMISRTFFYKIKKTHTTPL